MATDETIEIRPGIRARVGSFVLLLTLIFVVFFMLDSRGEQSNHTLRYVLSFVGIPFFTVIAYQLNSDKLKADDTGLTYSTGYAKQHVAWNQINRISLAPTSTDTVPIHIVWGHNDCKLILIGRLSGSKTEREKLVNYAQRKIAS